MRFGEWMHLILNQKVYCFNTTIVRFGAPAPAKTKLAYKFQYYNSEIWRKIQLLLYHIEISFNTTIVRFGGFSGSFF